MGLTAGTTLGRYELKEKLGAGGMAEVWEAFDRSLHRTVAIKVVLENMSADEASSASASSARRASSRASATGASSPSSTSARTRGVPTSSCRS